MAPDDRGYDEAALRARLENVLPERRSAFAAACAERLLPLFERYARALGVDSDHELRDILGRVWALGDRDDPALLARSAEEMAPDDEDDDWIRESGYAQNAASAVAHAAGTWLTGDAREAAWAARHLYEAADYAAENMGVLGTPLIDEAVAALDSDLTSVEAGVARDELRARADREGRLWADRLP